MSEASTPALWQLDDLRIDLARQRVERDGAAVNVSGLSFQLLRYLIAQGDRVVGFDELIAQVWAPAIVNEETVTQRVKLLRQALGDDGRQPRYIRSVRGQGYQLCVAPRAWVEPASAAAASVVSDLHPAVSDGVQRQLPARAIAVVGVIVLLLMLVGVWRWQSRPSTTGSAPAPSSTLPAGSELLQRAAYYAGIGQRDDNERAIALYQRVLEESPRNVPARLGLSRAYSARVCLFNYPPQWAQQAQDIAQGVIEEQPELAPAWMALGYSQDCRGRINDALRGYEKAVQLDPADDKSRASAAYLYERKGRLADALIANTSLHGDPARVRFLPLQLASNLDLLGYPQAAEARYRRSFELYPDNVFSNIAWPRFLFRQNRLTEAQAALDEALHRGTAHVDLYLLQAELALLLDKGDARAACQQAAALRPQASLPATLGLLLQQPKDQAQVRARADALQRDLASDAVYPADWLEVALLRDASGDHPAAITAMQRAVDAGYRDVAYLQVSPWFASLRTQPQFARLLDHMQRLLVEERGKVPAQKLEALGVGGGASAR